MLRLLGYADQLPDTVRIKTYGNLGILYNKMANADSSEFFLRKAIVASKGHPIMNARMYCNLGISYRTISQYEKSLKVLDTALAIYVKENNKEGKGIVYGEMASNYNYMLQSEQAMEYLKKSIQILTEVGNKREIYAVKQKLANLYYNNGNYSFAKDLYAELLPEFKKNQTNNNYYYTLMNYADCLIYFEDYREAENALKEVRAGLSRVANKEYMWISVSKIGLIYYKTGRLQKAEKEMKAAYNGLYELNSPRFTEAATQYLDYLNKEQRFDLAIKVVERIQGSLKIPRLKMNADNEINFLKQAIITYSRTGMVENSLHSFERMDFLKDSVNNATNQEKVLELQETYQNDLQKEKNSVLEKNNALLMENSSKKDKILILGILVFLLIIATGTVVFLSYKRKIHMQKEMLVNLEISQQALEDKQRLEKKLYEERGKTLAKSERELVEVSLGMADLQKKLLDEIDICESPEQYIETSNNLRALLNKNNYWKYFKSKFVEVHPHFAIVLKEMFPNLSENEIAFCCMLKLHLTTSEIASLMGKSNDEIEMKISGLKRKMGLGEDELAFHQLITHME